MTASKHRDRLTAKQSLFAFYLARGYSQADAGNQVNYAPKRGSLSRTANLPAVRAEVDRLRQDANKSEQMSAEWWRGELLDVYQACRDAADQATALTALKLAGQHLGTLSSELHASDRERAFFAFLDASTRALSPPELPRELPPELPPVTVDVDVDGSSSSDSDGS